MQKILKKAPGLFLDITVPFGPFLRDAEKSRPFLGLPSLIYRVLPLTFFMFWLSKFTGDYGGFAYFLILVPLSAYAHITHRNYTSKAEIYKTILQYFIVVIIGFGSLWGFVGHMFLSDNVASSIGWDEGSPFQLELAFYHLGIGLAGLMCIWYRDSLWAGVVVVKSVFLYGAAYVHISDILVNQNFSQSNTGAVLVGDIVFPSILLVMLVLSSKTKSGLNA